MADFHTHVTFSSVLGCGYSVAGMVAGMPPSTALVAGGLCGVSGMLPDVDSDSGIPRRESMSFAAAIVPMLLVDRFDQMHFRHDERVLAAALLYIFIRFVLSRLIGRFSVHRGMWHSIPAVLIFAGVAFLIAGPANDLTVRYFKAFAVGLGAMSHLVLDEIYSVDTRGIVPKFKKSFGSAVKMWGKNGWANFSTYAKLAAVALAIAAEPSVLERIEQQNPAFAGRIRGINDRLQLGQPDEDATPPNQLAPPSPALPHRSPYPIPPGHQSPNNYQPGGRLPSQPPTTWPTQRGVFTPSGSGAAFPAQAKTAPPAIRRQ